MWTQIADMPRFIIRVICFGYLVSIEKFSQFLVDFSQALSVLDGTGIRVSAAITGTPIIRNDGFGEQLQNYWFFVLK